MRRRRAKRKPIDPEPVYGSRLLSRFINRVMKDGKKSVARRLVYQALERVKEKGEDPLLVFKQAVENVRPTMEVRPRRVGGAAYQVPMPVKGERQTSLAIRWLIMAARARPNSQYNTFEAKLAAELLAAAQGEGGAVKKRAEMLRLAQANRAFAHFRW
jgi:small subunit ribosomal protein S7